MKILVANPPWPGPGYGARSDVRWPHKRSDKLLEHPIYLAYVVAVLKEEGFEVDFVDGILDELSIPEFAKVVKNKQAEMVILETSTPSIEYDLLTAKTLKEKIKDIFVVLVGSHATFFHEEIMRENEFLDCVCRGEFDFTIKDLAITLSQKGDLKEVKGITFRDKDGIHINEDRSLIQNLDEIPFPARDIVKDKNYRQGTFMGKLSTTMVSSRGCPYRCIFCLWPNILYGHKCRMRSAENVVDEIEEAVKKYGIDEIYFDDDSFALDKKRVLKICELIKKHNLKVRWIAQCRVSSIQDEEIANKMREAGCHYIRFGVESGSQRMLDFMKKGITLGQVRKAFKLCRKAGIKTQAFFLFGIPGETWQAINESIEFAKKIKPDSAQFAIAIPHPGTELYEICKKNGWLKYKKWEDFSACNSLIETDELSRKDLEEARVKAYREFYLRPAYIIRTLYKIKSFSYLVSTMRSAKSISSRMAFFEKVNS
ncbi:MAG: radical SAM protein [Candidatus Aerophobetes bacterium]|nr:radical SAM protein [Candidatus Aerophobetes bacterium]